MVWIVSSNGMPLDKFYPSNMFKHKQMSFFSNTCCSHRKKRMRELQKKMQAGLIDKDEDNPFEMFISSTDIRYCYYHDTHKILGNTYGMCVIQVSRPFNTIKELVLDAKIN